MTVDLFDLPDTAPPCLACNHPAAEHGAASPYPADGCPWGYQWPLNESDTSPT